MVPSALGLALGMESGGSVPAGVASSAWERELGPKGLLNSWGVDGLVLSDAYAWGGALQSAGWRLVEQRPGASLWHRDERQPLVQSVEKLWVEPELRAAAAHLLLRPAGETPATLIDATRPPGSYEGGPVACQRWWSARNAVAVDLSSDSPLPHAYLAFRRPFFEGYRAWLDGRPVRVLRFNLTQLAVELPGRCQGHLVVEYWPMAFTWSLGLAALCVALVALGYRSQMKIIPSQSAGVSS